MNNVLLDIRGLNAWQRDLQVLFDVHLQVHAGSVVALIGANGAGKSSLMDSLAGLVRNVGSVLLDGTEIQGSSPASITRAGLALVPEGRRLFSSLSIEENLLIGAASGRPGPWTLEKVYELFPVLRDKRHTASNALSGGQQQQAAIGRGLMANPRILLCDEISLGLSPAVVRSIYAQLPVITAAGTAVVLVEQNTALAMVQAQYIYCLREGRIVLEGAPDTLSSDAVSRAYFGAPIEEHHHA